MPTKSNIELGSGRIYLSGLDESIDISDAEINADTEWADDKEYVKINAVRDLMEATIECEPVQFNREWTLAYCKICRQPIPITEMFALLYGKEGWACPLCTVKERMRTRKIHSI